MPDFVILSFSRYCIAASNYHKYCLSMSTRVLTMWAYSDWGIFVVFPPPSNMANALANAMCERCKSGFAPAEKIVNSNGELYHEQCFVCAQCFQQFPEGLFYEVTLWRGRFFRSDTHLKRWRMQQLTDLLHRERKAWDANGIHSDWSTHAKNSWHIKWFGRCLHVFPAVALKRSM